MAALLWCLVLALLEFGLRDGLAEAEIAATPLIRTSQLGRGDTLS